MKKNNYVLCGIRVVLAFGVAILLAHSDVINAQDCRLVMIHSGEKNVAEGIVIEPVTVWASKGTCVIWSNWLRERQVKVMFNEGKKTEIATGAVRGFELDAANAYLTSWIPTGGTASLKFNEEGTFGYVAADQNGMQARGEIIIQ